jgi:hypothetical protein
MTARSTRTRRALLGLMLLVAAGAGVALVGHEVQSSASGGADPAQRPDLQESVVFYYQRIDPVRDGPKFRGASAVVTSAQPDERTAVSTIHAYGAKAFMYMNVYWFPTGRVYEGVDISRHPGWAFCARGDRPLAGRREDGSTWYYLDLNERPARAAVMAYLRHLKALGFDGVFFDRGSPSLRGAGSSPIAWESSTCTADPVTAGGPRFANVFVDLLHRVRERLGLTVFINYGHPYSGPRLRPDPDNPGCRAHRSSCRYLSDVWSDVDRVIDENANPPTLAGFDAEYRENLASEKGGSRRGAPSRVIRAVKVSSVDRPLVFYLWARARLFRLATFVNTGDDHCPGASAALRRKCQRWGTYPELTRVRLGEPLDPLPRRTDCLPGSADACVWVRRYALGAVVVNTRPSAGHLAGMALGVSGCRRVVSVSAQGRRPAGTGSACVSVLAARLPLSSGTVFTYR